MQARQRITGPVCSYEIGNSDSPETIVITQGAVKRGEEIMTVVYKVFPGVFSIQDHGHYVLPVSGKHIPDPGQFADKILNGFFSFPARIGKTYQVRKFVISEHHGYAAELVNAVKGCSIDEITFRTS